MSTAEILDDPNLIAKTIHTVLGANNKKLKKWIIILAILLVLVVVSAIITSMVGIYCCFFKKKDKFKSVSKYDDENDKYLNS